MTEGEVIWSGDDKTQKELKEQVRDVMEDKKGCRNSDRFLIWYFWNYKEGLDIEDYDSVQEGAQPSTLIRKRREIQNEDGDLLPTKPEVLKQRKIKEEEIREFYSESRAEEILEKL